MNRGHHQKRLSGRSFLLKDNSDNKIIADSMAMLRANDFNDYYIEQFTSGVACLLNDYAYVMGEKAAVEYSLTRKLSKVELRMQIPGASYDVFTNGSEARKRQFELLTGININAELVSTSYKYESGCNVISVSLPLSNRHKPIYKNSMFLAISLGIVLGCLCLLLPDTVKSFLIDDLASSVKSVILNMLAGISGPVVFISIISSIIALESINDLTNLAVKILKRFVLSILFTMAVSLVVSAFFFNSFGNASINFEPSYLIELVLSILPTNIIDPFLNNNIPQLVVLGVVMGSALLLLGDKVAMIKEALLQINQWIMGVMKIVFAIIPLIPFLSLLTTIASGNFSDILKGWEFIAAAYIVFTICVVVKAIKTSLVTHIPIPDFCKKIKPAIVTAFTTGSSTASMTDIYEVSDKELGIKPEFTSLWISMWFAMFSVKTTVYLILSTLMVAELSGTAVTVQFIFTLCFLTLELSLASPGATTALTIVFTVLGMPTDYVGLFSIYRVVTENFGTACTLAQSMFEQLEAAHRLGGMKKNQETIKETQRSVQK